MRRYAPLVLAVLLRLSGGREAASAQEEGAAPLAFASGTPSVAAVTPTAVTIDFVLNKPAFVFYAVMPTGHAGTRPTTDDLTNSNRLSFYCRGKPAEGRPACLDTSGLRETAAVCSTRGRST